MVRLSLANMYLHGFTDPHIVEYDTLTSDERWNEFADVILANPPFMSPKGGIRPHNRFSVPSNRSEVLFVDYMAEHLTPNGRAGIIVPEGVIFQSGKAYKALRKELVEKYLVAVVSLPAGVFNPYSGVKTSILILDRAGAKANETIGFFKVTNDGFGLGAQRRETGGGELPEILAEIADYRANAVEEAWEGRFGRAVAKAEIAASGDYNLSGERYRAGRAHNHAYPLVRLGDERVFAVEAGGTPKSDVEEYWNGDVLWATLVDLPAGDFVTQIHNTRRKITKVGLAQSAAKLLPPNSVIVSTRATIGRIAINRQPVATNQGFKNIVIRDEQQALPEFVAYMVKQLVPAMQALATGGTFTELSKSRFCELEIPLPPLDVQREIVAEIEGYQKVIDGARAVVSNYKPHIDVDPRWPVVALGDAVRAKSGNSTIIKGRLSSANDGTLFPAYSATGQDVYSPTYGFEGDGIVISAVGARCGKCFLASGKWQAIANTHVLIPVADKADARYIWHLVNDENFWVKGGSAQPFVKVAASLQNEIPLPNIETQRLVTAELEAERKLVESNRELIARMEKKIETAIARVWCAAELHEPALAAE